MSLVIRKRYFLIIWCYQSLLYAAHVTHEWKFFTRQEEVGISTEDVRKLVSISPIIAGQYLKSNGTKELNQDYSISINPTQLHVLLLLARSKEKNCHIPLLQAAQNLSNQSVHEKINLLTGLLRIIEIGEILQMNDYLSAAYQLYRVLLHRKSIKKQIAHVSQSQKEALFFSDSPLCNRIIKKMTHDHTAYLLTDGSLKYTPKKSTPFISSHSCLRIVRSNGSDLLCANQQNIGLINEDDHAVTWQVPVSFDEFNRHTFVSDVAFCRTGVLAVTYNAQLLQIGLANGTSEPLRWFPVNYLQEKFAYYTFSSDGKQLLRNDTSEHIITVYDCETQACKHTVNVNDNIICSTAFCPDTSQITFGSTKGDLYWYDVRNADNIGHHKLSKKPITKLVCSPNNDLCAALSRDKKLRIWDIKNNKAFHYSLPAVMNNAVWLTNHSLALTSDRAIYVHDLYQAVPVCYMTTNALETRNQKIIGLAVNPSNNRLALGYDGGSLHTIDGPIHVTQAITEHCDSMEAFYEVTQQIKKKPKSCAYARSIKKVFKKK